MNRGSNNVTPRCKPVQGRRRVNANKPWWTNERNVSIWITRSYPRFALNVRGCNLFINLSPPLWRREEEGRKCSLHGGFSSFFSFSFFFLFFFFFSTNVVATLVNSRMWQYGWMWQWLDGGYTHGFSHGGKFQSAFSLPHSSFLSNSLISLNILSITFQFALSPTIHRAHLYSRSFASGFYQARCRGARHIHKEHSQVTLEAVVEARDNNKNRTVNVSLLIPGSIVGRALRRVLSNYLQRCASRITNR